jgi:DNA-binding NarL/FixJ family response regulator
MRLFIAEEDSAVRLAYQMYLQQKPGYQVIGIADNGNGLPSQLKASQPDVLLLDWYLPGESTNELIADIRALALQLKIVGISIHPEDESEARAAGVDAFITKVAPPDKLLVLLNTMKSQTTTGEPVSSKGE